MSNVHDLIKKVDLILEQPPSVRRAMALQQVVTSANLVTLIESYRELEQREQALRADVSRLSQALDYTRNVVEALGDQVTIALNRLPEN